MSLGLPATVEVCLFDLDGVLTDTAVVHAQAWRHTFDRFLRQRVGSTFRPFDVSVDYGTYVDGKVREDGVRDFLASRGITLPEGDPDDRPSAQTVHGLSNRKNEELTRRVAEGGVRVFPGSLRYLEAAEDIGLRRFVVSSSANARLVLRSTGLDRFVEGVVDGVTLVQQHLPGKPRPDAFLAGARLAGVLARQAAVFEDALAGVEAARAGKFGFVVGVDRLGQAAQLRSQGADVVVGDLADLLGGSV